VKELGLKLPNPQSAKGNYRMVTRDGNFLYISGHGPQEGESFVFGRLGEDLETEDGVRCAELGEQPSRLPTCSYFLLTVACSMLATLKNELGSLNKIKRVVKTLGFVNCTSDFMEQVTVIDGFSNTMAEVFGEENGVGVRSALGTNQLPFKIAVEVEAIVELRDDYDE
jgi:enamine deaminase RidA (YjgF/YER057c/UK114 family)